MRSPHPEARAPAARHLRSASRGTSAVHRIERPDASRAPGPGRVRDSGGGRYRQRHDGPGAPADRVTAAGAWTDALAAWAVPEEILRAAVRSPWEHPVARFAARADAALALPEGESYAAAAAALVAARAGGGPGTVLDVGAGAGAAGLPLAATGTATALTAVDTSAAMLAAVQERAEAPRCAAGADRAGALAGRGRPGGDPRRGRLPPRGLRRRRHPAVRRRAHRGRPDRRRGGAAPAAPADVDGAAVASVPRPAPAGAADGGGLRGRAARGRRQGLSVDHVGPDRRRSRSRRRTGWPW